MRRGEVATRWRAALAGALDEAGVPTTAQRGTGPGRDRVSHHHAATVCAASAFVPAEDFQPTSVTVARALALSALAAGAPAPGPRGAGGPTPAARIAAAVADPSSVPGWVADWLGGLDRAGRAAVASDAVRWMADALALVRRRGEPEWRHPDPLRHAPPGRGVTLTAAVDAVRRTGAVHLLAVRLRPSPADGRLVRRLALLWALESGEEPASVVLGFREPLELAMHPVGPDALGLAVAEAVEDVSWAVLPSSAPVIPGPACRHCALLDACAPGAAHERATRAAPFPTQALPTQALPTQAEAEGDPTM